MKVWISAISYADKEQHTKFILSLFMINIVKKEPATSVSLSNPMIASTFPYHCMGVRENKMWSWN